MRTCVCGHYESSHGERLAREGKVRTLPLACKAVTPRACQCEKFVEKSGNGATIGEIDKLRREITLARSAANKRYAELLGELDRLKATQAS